MSVANIARALGDDVRGRNVMVPVVQDAAFNSIREVVMSERRRRRPDEAAHPTQASSSSST